MEISLSIRFSWKIWIYLSFFMMLCNQGIFAERGGFLHFRFICFQNPGHYSSDGKVCDFSPSINCDLFFRICISSHPIPDNFLQQHCPIHFKETQNYDNEEYVCNKANDNRKSLSETVVKELPYPLQQTFYIKIDVSDDDFGGPTHVASFRDSFIQRPSPNSSTPTFVLINMPRSERRYHNNKASMKVEMALRCDRDRYGEFCMDFCKSGNYDNYVCSDRGKKICKEGWRGDNCDKPDLCLYVACVPRASCFEIKGEAKCFCNGHMGPQCYLDYDPCKNNPCLNNGRCIPNRINGVGLRCHCEFPFYGSHCESKIDMCLVEPCYNNATCVNENNVRHCICLKGFSGKLCDQKFINSNQTKNNTGLGLVESKNPRLSAIIISCILFATSLMLFIGIVIIHVLKKRHKKKYKFSKNKDMPIKMSDLNDKLTTPVISNQCDDKTNVYDTVEDQNTYAYLKDNDDFYVVPSTAPTPGFASSPGVTSTIYMEMSSNNDMCLEQPKEEVTRDSLGLPPLPSRDIKRKMSIKTFCLP